MYNTSVNWGVIGGGSQNTSTGSYSVIGGGSYNEAWGAYSVIGGGYLNKAGVLATVPGGIRNEALGSNSFAAGAQAKALHNGTFVWGDAQTNEFASVTNDEFAVRAANGLRLVGGAFIGNGSGLTNLNVNSFSGSISASSLPTSGVWNVSGMILSNMNVQGSAQNDLDMGGHKIINLGSSVNDTDAASQGRVKTMMQQVPEYGDLSMGEFTSQVAMPDRTVPVVIHTEDLADEAVTAAKIVAISNLTVLGNVSGSLASPEEVRILDEDNMSSNSNTGIPTQQSVKSYVDSTSDTVAKSYAMKYSGTVVRTGTIPSTWTDLDLSGVIGTNRAFVYLRFDNPTGAAFCTACVRENGTTKDVYSYNLEAGTLSGNANADMQFELATVTDESGVIEIRAPSYCGATNTTIKVILYQILQ
jgi:hypothetical protein